MIANLKINKCKFLALILFFIGYSGFSQWDTSTLKGQLSLGVNSPSSDGFVADYEGKSFNFPTVNLGVQYMFWSKIGVKLDYGFNRISNQDQANYFKLNYSRINLQLVYDASSFRFVPNRLGIYLHTGPGVSMLQPLADYKNNKSTNFNVMGGLELHYAVSDKLSLFVDGSYILGFADDFNPITEGYGSFNGDLLTLTLGVSISISGCNYCF
ncbi:outer membrane beta-barrel protein [Gaetbulibacter saemankumensis]|uniref:outer membrane beta-barrel protein n=1 Tax=Gaetbulibacter saemankumensis TaxID=311208 RepID=UPI000429E344|nr:outer membrane beta-barrel protein [Gaetbulibacter saemankumensis]